MTLTIAIEGTGVIANCDGLTDSAGGTWSAVGGGTVTVSNDVFLINGVSMGSKYASKDGVTMLDKGATTYNFTSGGGQEGELIYIWMSATAIGTLDTLSTNPFCIRLGYGTTAASETNDYMDFLVAGNDDANGWTGGWKCFVIDPMKAPTRSDTTTYTLAQIRAHVQSIGMWVDCSSSARADSFFIGGIIIGSGVRVTGTSTTGWQEVVNYCTAYATRGWGMWQEREGIYYSYGKTIIGDDATPQAAAVSFTDSARIIQFGKSEYYTGSAWVSSMPVGASGIVIEDDAAATTGVTTFSDGILVGSEKGRAGSVIVGNSLLDVSLDLYGGSNADSVTTLYGTSIKDCTGPINSGNDAQHKFLGVSFSGCSQFDPVGAPAIRNCVFAETADGYASLLWNENIAIENCNFIANTIGAAVEHPNNDGYAYTHTSLIYSGNTKDILNSSGSTITITKGGDPISNPSTSEGSAVNFQASLDMTITVQNSNTAPLENVQTAIYKTSDRTELMNKDTRTINDGNLVIDTKYTIVTVGTSDFTTVGAASNAVGVIFTATGIDGGGDGTVTDGVATESYVGATPANIEIRCRKSSSGSTKYKNFSTLATLTGNFDLLITLLEDPINNASS